MRDEERVQPTLVLFDVDGTLIDTAGAGKRAIEAAFDELFGVESIAERAPNVRFAGMTDRGILEALAAAVGLDGAFAARREEFERAYLAALERIMQRPDPRWRVLPGVGALLDTLDARADTTLGLLTGNIERGARLKLEPFGLNRYFPGGGFGSEHTDRAELARIAVRELSRHAGIRFEAGHVAVIGDTDQDVACARANGFRAIAVDTGWVSREVLESSGPDALFSDLTDGPRVLAALGLS